MPNRRKAQAVAQTIPVIDLFAGPGGLGEGFSSCLVNDQPAFQLALSIEMDAAAHQTLELRAFMRKFDQPPAEYWEHLRGRCTRTELFEAWPSEALAAKQEARRLKLSARTAGRVREMVSSAISKHDKWVLIGGPPCQAYSLVGRSRNRNRADYIAEKDHRHMLYVEYLQLLADHAPPVFVMENVKGLLSARFRNEGIFDRIRADLKEPAKAIRRRRRDGPPTKEASYTLVPLTPQLGLMPGLDPADFLVRAENHGVPQARHRVIIVGIRDNIDATEFCIPTDRSGTVRGAIGDLPRLRSGLSRGDELDAWRSTLARSLSAKWFKSCSDKLKAKLRSSVDATRLTTLDRGAEFVAGPNDRCPELGGWCNHSTRGHMATDLQRYLFASCFAEVYDRSPDLSEFPEELLPQHANVNRALDTGHFADRFRVQRWTHPSSTVTSHISKDGHYYIHPDPAQCRSLTVREAARLQTFPDDYFFCGPRTAQYQQVGNAVPPALARLIAQAILPMLR